MNFYKRHIGDYLKDTAHLTLLEHGVYTRLLDVYYTRESGIPDAQAARLIGARGKEEFAALKVVLDEFFELIDGTWIQDRCEREIHATGPKSDDADHAPAKSGKALRQQAYRERRAALFEALRERGITMPFKATMDELQDALLNVTKPSRVTDDVTACVTPTVTDEPHNVTATISHKPDSISHKPEAAHTAVLPPAGDDTSDAPPEFPSSLTPEQKAAVPLVVKLRALGVSITSANPLAAEWIAKGLTVERADEAVEFARLKGKPSGPIHPNFLNALIDDILAPKAPKKRADDWYRTNPGIERKASELGIVCPPGKDHHWLREKCESVMRSRSQGVAA
ncbi:YdaU family protein [Paraburkholderia rhynchosiae]|uniref:YdaU family protein n=1 Tax=Paraburkholderia rhynchosiae TaxID=487049 RepID=A0ACC7N3S5_9BURK